jgi:hypothetical protein
MYAGSECVRALTHDCDAATALRALNDRWRTRRGYFWRSLAGVVWSIGKQKQSDRWWVATSLHATTKKYFVDRTYPSFEAAKIAVAYMASTGGVA